MSGLDEFELDKRPDEEPGRAGGRFPGGLVAAGVLLVAGITWLSYLAFRRPAAPKPVATPSTEAPAPAAVASATPDPTLPALDQSDAFVRDLLQRLSSHPLLALGLKTSRLVRTAAVVVENVAAGESPTPHLEFLRPQESFRVAQKRGRLVVDPRSYARYDAFADAVASVDAAACASAYRRLEPLLEAAYRELGHPQGGFRAALDRALASLLEVPVVEGDVPVRSVVKAVVVYEYVDAGLEGLLPAQKNLLRTGPRNVGLVKTKLHEFKAGL